MIRRVIRRMLKFTSDLFAVLGGFLAIPAFALFCIGACFAAAAGEDAFVIDMGLIKGKFSIPKKKPE